MTRVWNKTIYDDIRYNHLNLPRHIRFTAKGQSAYKNLEFIWDASGTKLATKKWVEPTLGADSIIMGEQKEYAGNIVYRRDTAGNLSLSLILFDEGRITRDSAGNYHYEYFIKDHLGNTRLVRRIEGETMETVQQNDYYPLGMLMGGMDAMPKKGDNEYLYNGKELQDQFNLNWYDYGARFYDPALARWHVIDNKSEKYKSITPYAYAANNPVRFIDPDGNEIVDAAGNTMYTQSGGWKDNATKSAKTIAKAMLKTKTGRSQWNKMVNSDIKVTLILSEGLYQNRSNVLGSTDPVVRINSSTGEIYTDKEGITDVTIYLKAIKESMDEGKVNEGLTTEQAIGATAAHEAEHAVDEDNIEKQNAYRNEKTSDNYDAMEAEPKAISAKVREESRNAPKKKKKKLPEIELQELLKLK